MVCKTFSKFLFEQFVNGLIQNHLVEAPQAKGDKFAFSPLKKFTDLRLDHDVTILPPKKYFLPPVETLLAFEGQTYQPVFSDQKFILLGVHPYDIHAFQVLDKLFETQNPDAHYLKRRKNITVIGCDIINPATNAFFNSVDTGIADKGYDIMLTDCGTYFVADIATPEGQALIEKLDTKESTPEEMAKRKEIREAIVKQIQKDKLNYAPTELPARLEKNYDSQIWKKSSENCFSCGSCNLVCPTCYCFDVRDDVEFNLKNGKRERVWDGCLLEDFASVLGGQHNFRKQKEDRYRHRYFRKGTYIYNKIGLLGCVGCGRCTTNCVPNIANPTTLFNQLGL
jgi:ferredoxin